MIGLGELISRSSQKKCFDLLSNFLSYRKSSIKPVQGAYLFQAHLREGLIEMGGVGWGAHFRGWGSGKAQVQEGWRSCSQGSESNPNFHLVNKPFQISPHKRFSLVID